MLAERRLVVGLASPSRHDLRSRRPLGQVERRLDRVGEPTLDPISQHEPVDHDRDVVGLVALEVELELLVEVDQFTVDDRPNEALPGEVGEQGVVRSLPAPHHRGQHLEAHALLHGEDLVDDLLWRLPNELFTCLGIMGDADTSEQQAEVVVDLGDRADGRPRVAAAQTSGRSRSPATALR